MPIRVSSRPSILLFIATAMLLVAAATSDCPSLCECKWKNGKESVRCHSANLTEIPPRLDAGTQVLDLQRNELLRLDADEFSTVNLANLQKIFLIDCHLAYLHRFAFRNLINLVELDLTDNRLDGIPTHIFDSMGELRELRLSGNPVRRLDNLAFNGLTRLVRLELSNCRIARIELRAFEGVRRTLEWLKLDGNELINVQPAALTILNHLHGIELTRNNWNCTCSLRPLREWMVQQNIPYEFEPVCASPDRLKGRAWSRTDIDEFACPPIIAVIVGRGGGSLGNGNGNTVKAIEGQNVTIGCSIVAGNPDPTIRWMFRNRVIVGNVSLRTTSGASSSAAASPFGQPAAPPPPPESSNSRSSVAAITTLDTRKKFYHHLGKTSTNVTIAWIDSHDSGPYKCIAENGAGRTEATISVLVYSRHYLIDSNNNVIEASVALAHSNNRFIFIISTIVAVLFVIFSLLLAICYYTVHRKNSAAAALAIAGGGGSGGGHHHHGSSHHQQQNRKKKVLNKKSFSFLLCQKRTESYEKIEMLVAAAPNHQLTRTDDETTFKIYSEHQRRRPTMTGPAAAAEDEMATEDDDTVELTGSFGKSFAASSSLSPESKSIRDKRRRSMSLNLSNSPAMNPQRRKVAASAATRLSCKRNAGGDYSNVPTTADEDSAGLDKLMVTARTDRDGGAGTEWALFTKHQAQSDDNRLDKTQQSFFSHGDAGETTTAAAAAVNVHQKVTVGRDSSSASRTGDSLSKTNINLSTISGGNFSHPLADLCPLTGPLINISSSSADPADGQLPSDEVIRHHVMRKRVLSQEAQDREMNKSGGIVIYTTAVPAAATKAPQSLAAEPVSPTTIVDQVRDDNYMEFDEDGDKLGRLSPTLNSIIRNDENFDLFDVKSNLDEFYVKQLNYDYHQLQMQQRQPQHHHRQVQNHLLMGHASGEGSGKLIPNQNYFCSLPRKKSYESKKNLLGLSAVGEDLYDAPLGESLFRPQQKHQQRQKSNSELNLLMMSSLDAMPNDALAYQNGMSFISNSTRGGGTTTDDEHDNGRIDGRHGTIIKPLSDNNKATPLLNFPTASASSSSSSAVVGPTKVMAATGTGMAMGPFSGSSSGAGIFPSNCTSPSIMMGGSSGPLTSSILSPTNASSVASSSSPASSASSSAKKVAATLAANGSGAGGGSTKGVGGDYDYHAAQLEMFLDEYKRLQHQLCKMKETCDSIRRTEMLYGSYPTNPSQQFPQRLAGNPNKSGMPIAAASISSALAGSESIRGIAWMPGPSGEGNYDQYYPMNKTLLEKSNILLGNEPAKPPLLLPLSNKHKSYSGATPEPPPYWLHRNELLKGIQHQQQSRSHQKPLLVTGPPIYAAPLSDLNKTLMMGRNNPDGSSDGGGGGGAGGTGPSDSTASSSSSS